MSTHNLCFRAKIRKNVYSCTPLFYYIKVGCKGIYITRTCYHDDLLIYSQKLCSKNWLTVDHCLDIIFPFQTPISGAR